MLQTLLQHHHLPFHCTEKVEPLHSSPVIGGVVTLVHQLEGLQIILGSLDSLLRRLHGDLEFLLDGASSFECGAMLLQRFDMLAELLLIC